MRIVVVGNGMVGSRFVDEVCSRATHFPSSPKITVLGDEPYGPYNRVLLSDVVAGRTSLSSLQVPRQDDPCVTTLTRVAAVRIHRPRRVVIDDLGDEHAYDHLVLATGADANRPSLPGADARTRGVHVLRDLDDTRRLLAAAANARSAVILGTGVLGLELATGLAARGVAATLVGRGAVLDRHLDAGADAAITTALCACGVSTVHGRDISVTTALGRVTGVVVDDASLSADLLVVACGTTPRTRLAADAGLLVDRGIVVDDHLTTPTDPHIYAIGDCAQPPSGATGLIAQGWDQAAKLAARLAGEPAALTDPSELADPSKTVEPAGLPGTGPVIMVKSERLSAVVMGDAGAHRRPGDRRLVLMDPDGGRHIEVSVRGSTLAGAICIGDPDLAADLSAAYTRSTPVPLDPAQLLVRPTTADAARADPGTLTRLPDRSTVCRCNGVTKGDVVNCWKSGARTVEDVAKRTRATTGCGTCADTVGDLLAWVSSAEESSGTTSSAGPDIKPHVDLPSQRSSISEKTS